MGTTDALNPEGYGAFGLLARQAWIASTDQAELRQAPDMQRVDVWLTESTRTG
jgi:hypothetical protein